MMDFPFRVRLTDEDIVKKLKLLNHNRWIPSDRKIATWVGIHCKPIRKQFFIGTDNSRGDNGISIKSIDLKIDFKPAYGKRKGFDAIFDFKF